MAVLAASRQPGADVEPIGTSYMILTMPWRPSPGSFDSVGPLPGSNNRAGKQAVPGLSGPCAVATARSLSQWSQLRRQRRIVVFPGGPKDPGPQTRDTAMPIGEAPARSRCVTNSATARAVRRTSRSSYYVKGLGVAFWGTEPCGAGCWRAPMRSLPGGGCGGVADGSGVGHRSGLLCLGSGHANGAGCQGSGFVVMLV